MSGRTSQDTVDSQADYNGDESEENQIIQPARPQAPVQRRRVRCLFPLLVAVFLVLVGVITTPLVVFIANGTAGEVPFLGRFFGSKNDTGVSDLVGLAAVTQTATGGGESGSPSGSTPAKKGHESVAELGGRRRDLRSPVPPLPPGIARGARGTSPRRRDSSNRERVYAPTVEDASMTTRISMGLVEVQALTEQVIVVPKGGVMSKLRAAAGSGDEENGKVHLSGRHRVPVRAAGVQSAAVRGGTASNSGHQQSSTNAPVGRMNVSANYSRGHPVTVRTARGGSIVTVPVSSTTILLPSPSTPLVNDSSPSLHSLKKRHSWVGHKKTHRRMRRKKALKRDSAPTSAPSRRNASLHTTNASAPVRAKHDFTTVRYSDDANETTGPATIARSTGKTPKLSSGNSNALNSRAPAKFGTPKGPFPSDNESFSTPKEIITVGNELQVTMQRSNSSAAGDTNYQPGRGTAIDGLGPLRALTEGVAGLNEMDAIVKNGQKLSTPSSKFVTSSKGPHSREVPALTAVLLPLTTAQRDSPNIEKGSSLMDSESISTPAEPYSDTSAHHQTPQDMDDSSESEVGKFINFKSGINDTLEDSDADDSDDEYLNHARKRESNPVVVSHAATDQTPGIPHAAAKLTGNASSTSDSYDTGMEGSTTSGLFTSSWNKFRKQNLEGDATDSNIATVERRDTAGGLRPAFLSPTNETSDPANASAGAWNPSNVTHQASALTKDKQRITDYAVPNAPKPSPQSTVKSDRPRLLEIEVKFPVPRKRQKLSVVKRNSSTLFSSTEKSLGTTHGARWNGRSLTETTLSFLEETQSSSPAAWQRSQDTLVAINSAANTSRLPAAVTTIRKYEPPASNNGSEISTVRIQASSGGDDDDDDDDDDEDDKDSMLLRTTEALLSPEFLTLRTSDSLAFAEQSTVTEPESEGVTVVVASSSNASVEPNRTRNNILAGNNAGSTTSRIRGGNLRLDISFNPENRSEATTLSNTSQTARVAVSIVDTEVPTIKSLSSAEPPHATSGPVKEEATHPSTPNVQQSNAVTNQTRTQASTTTVTASSLTTGRARIGPLLNGTDESSVWRTILPPKNSPNSTTVAPSSSIAVGVEYYDDSKNDSMTDGSASAKEGGSEATLHKRRVGGEIEDSTSRVSKKSDVFQTEYYYDEGAVSSKPEESTKDDTTVAEYENAPEQEVIDELFF